MIQSLQVRQEKEASFTGFLLYFLRLGTVGFGRPIALASRMGSDLVAERGWMERQDYLEGLALAPSCDLKAIGAIVLQPRNAGQRKSESGCRAESLTLYGGL
jgi:hypothetical protein